MTSWQPLLRGDDATRALDAVRAIASDLEAIIGTAQQTLDASLAEGVAGIALFFEYLDRIESRIEWRAERSGQHGDAGALRDRCIDICLETLSATPSGPSLFAGFPGVAWTLAHLERHAGDIAQDDGIEEVVVGFVERGRHLAPPSDLIDGGIGLGVYALERYPVGHSGRIIERLIDGLDRAATRDADGLTWRSPAHLLYPDARRRWPAGMINLGLAHGVPGVLGFLASCVAAGACPDASRALLDQAVPWLLAHRPEDGSAFPRVIAPDEVPEAANLAWCYGDNGLALSLWRAGAATGRDDWRASAIDIGRTAAARLAELEAMREAGICHGAGGVGHIFNCLHQETGIDEFADAAQAWLRRALALRLPERGVGGFQALELTGDGEPVWRDDPTLLLGAAGVGLTLAAAVSPVAPEWGRAFLLC